MPSLMPMNVSHGACRHLEASIISFTSAHKKHIGLYPGDKAVEHFADRLAGFKSSKGAIQIPYDKPLPLDLIAEIAKWCYETGNHP